MSLKAAIKASLDAKLQRDCTLKINLCTCEKDMIG